MWGFCAGRSPVAAKCAAASLCAGRHLAAWAAEVKGVLEQRELQIRCWAGGGNSILVS